MSLSMLAARECIFALCYAGRDQRAISDCTGYPDDVVAVFWVEFMNTAERRGRWTKARRLLKKKRRERHA